MKVKSDNMDKCYLFIVFKYKMSRRIIYKFHHLYVLYKPKAKYIFLKINYFEHHKHIVNII